MSKNILTSLLFACMLLISYTGFSQDQAAKDEKILTDYFAKNNIKATRTKSGLYYTIHQPGTGENAKPGQNVSMNYLGKFLDGKTFDGNIDANYTRVAGRDVFTFPLGGHRVISGWDEGVQLLNKGCRATLYLPSAIGYGANGGGPIPANSVLVFDVEVVAIN